MTRALAAVAVFCDDVREEVSGTMSVVGIMPDNVGVPAVPFAFPKLSVYSRIHLPIDYAPGPLEVCLRAPSQSDHILNSIGEDLVAKTINDARALGSPIAGLISRSTAFGYRVEQEGRILIVLKADKKEYVIGNMNITTGGPPLAASGS